MSKREFTEIRKQIIANTCQLEKNVEKLQEKCEYWKDAAEDYENNHVDKKQLLKNYITKLELIKRELKKDDFKFSFYIYDNLRVKAFKKIRNIQLDVHIMTYPDKSKTKKYLRQHVLKNEEKTARRRIREDLEAKFTEEELNRYYEKEILKLNTESVGNVFFETDAKEFWFDYDQNVKYQIRNPNLREDDISEFHGAIRRNIKKDKENHKNNLKVVAEYKRRMKRRESALQEKNHELQELHNELKYLNQIEKKYLPNKSK